MSRGIAVSIIIPAHGHAGMTDACVRAVLDDPLIPTDVEVLVIDDSSRDPLEIASADDERVRLLRTPRNLRFAGACNFGADAAEGNLLAFLNNDALAQAGWLEAMTGCMREDSSIAIVGARLLHRDGSVQHAGVAFSQRDGAPRHVYRGFPGDHPAITRERDFQAVTAACMLVRSEVFRDVGGFDTAFENGYEDIDLCMRVGSNGWRIRYCATATLHHHESISRRDEVEGLDPADDANLRLFMERWGDARRDELTVYAEDGLLEVGSGEIYPLVIRCAPELGHVTDLEDSMSLPALLNIRAHQVFDLQKDVGALAAQLLDHGIEPRL